MAQTGNILHVIEEETIEAFIFSVLLPDGSRVEDMKVQVEEEETLIVSLHGYTARKLKLRPEARCDGIKASFKDGHLTISVPKELK